MAFSFLLSFRQKGSRQCERDGAVPENWDEGCERSWEIEGSSDENWKQEDQGAKWKLEKNGGMEMRRETKSLALVHWKREGEEKERRKKWWISRKFNWVNEDEERGWEKWAKQSRSCLGKWPCGCRVAIFYRCLSSDVAGRHFGIKCESFEERIMWVCLLPVPKKWENEIINDTTHHDTFLISTSAHVWKLTARKCRFEKHYGRL